jgi:hypothetical protein
MLGSITAGASGACASQQQRVRIALAEAWLLCKPAEPRQAAAAGMPSTHSSRYDSVRGAARLLIST